MAAITGPAAAQQRRNGNTPVEAQSQEVPGGMGASIKFARGALRSFQAGTAITSTLGSGAVNQSHTVPMVNGWDRRLAFLVSVVTAGNSAAVALGADAPWALLQQITKKDNRQQLQYQLRGYSTYLQERYGGYHLFATEGDTDAFTALTTGAGATAPTGSFVIEIQDEFGRDGIGCWPNMDSSQRRIVDISLSALTNTALFSTPPNGTTTVTIRPIVYYYARPPAFDADNNAIEERPALAGSVQYWREQTEVLASGENVITVRMSGRRLRNVFGVFTDASDVRSNTVRPDNIRVELDNQMVFDCPRQPIAANLYKRWGLVSPTGFYPIHLGTLAPDGIPGSEWFDEYLPTSNGSQMTLKFSTGAAGKLFLVMNELVFPGPLPID